MSEMETHTGKLIPLMLGSTATFEQKAEQACREVGIEREDYHDTWVECLKDSGYRKLFVHNGVIYKIEDTEVDPYGFAIATENEDGTIDYIMSYYNGGASFDEALAAAFED